MKVLANNSKFMLMPPGYKTFLDTTVATSTFFPLKEKDHYDIDVRTSTGLEKILCRVPES